jgi:hypothetical protein
MRSIFVRSQQNRQVRQNNSKNSVSRNVMKIGPARAALFHAARQREDRYTWYNNTNFFQCTTVPSSPGSPHYRGFTVTLRHTTLGRNPLDECSTRRRKPYLTTRKIHNGHASILGGIQIRNPRKRGGRGTKPCTARYGEANSRLFCNKLTRKPYRSVFRHTM